MPGVYPVFILFILISVLHNYSVKFNAYLKEEKDMKKENKKKLDAFNTSSSAERKERISNGTWMGRGTVFTSKKSYKRSRDRKVPEE